MTKPFSEPSQGTQNAYLGWSTNQLQRRPAPTGSSPDACYEASVTTAVSDGTTAYNEYLRFTVPGGDLQLADYIEVTMPCTALNTSGNFAWLVQSITVGSVTLEPLPSLNFTKWKDNWDAKLLYRFLFQVAFVDPNTHIWMSDFRSQWGPYNMGLGSDGPFPATVAFTALEFGSQDLSSDIDVVFEARWTVDPLLGPAPAGITLDPLTTRVRKFGCP